jgi:hypothetical protein
VKMWIQGNGMVATYSSLSDDLSNSPLTYMRGRINVPTDQAAEWNKEEQQWNWIKLQNETKKNNETVQVHTYIHHSY